MCIDMFAPSYEFELYLINFLLRHADTCAHARYMSQCAAAQVKGSYPPCLGPIVRYCLRRLEEDLDEDEEVLTQKRARRVPPNVQQIFDIVAGAYDPYARQMNQITLPTRA